MTALVIPSLVGSVLIAGLSLTDAAASQGRGRGPSEAILSRSGSYFSSVMLPDVADGQAKVDLASMSLVKQAVAKKQLSLLYFFHPRANEMKHNSFEVTVFGNQTVRSALRFFKCGRIDLSSDPGATSKDLKEAPKFVAFDVNGKRVGEVSMRGYRASAKKLVDLLTKAAKGYSKKKSVSRFVKDYRSFLNDLTQIEAKKRTLDDKRRRLMRKPGNDSKLAKVDKAEQALNDEERELLDAETKLLELAKIPDRDEKATRLGDRPRRRSP